MSRGIVKAVDGVNLIITQNQTVGLVGESGCGKSMTAFSILGVVPNPGRIVGGKIMFEGKNLIDLTDNEMNSIRGKAISMVFQDPMTFLNPVMKVGDQVAEVIVRHQHVDKTESRKKTIDSFSMVRLPDPLTIFDYYPHQLSGGMRQRVMLAMALSCRPTLLIADEPTTALDVTTQLQMLSLMKKVKKEIGNSLLLITHDLGIVADICDRVCVMYAGMIVESADVFVLFENAKHPYSVALLRSVLTTTEYKDVLPTIKGTVPDLSKPPTGCRFHPRCPKAKPICSRQDPVPLEIEERHIVSCWLYS
jgi:peptide/nickel transport system ATP-binding protein